MKKIIFFVIIFFIAIQFICVDVQTDLVSPKEFEIVAPKEVMAILENSCFDCHFNSVQLPWYGSVAPFSWIVRGHINDGRKVVNFSNFYSYEFDKQYDLYQRIEKAIVIRMPLGSYTFAHSHAKLSNEEKKILGKWAKSQREATQTTP